MKTPYLEWERQSLVSLYSFLDLFHFLHLPLTNVDKIMTLEIICYEQLFKTSNYHNASKCITAMQVNASPQTNAFLSLLVVMWWYISAFANHDNFSIHTVHIHNESHVIVLFLHVLSNKMYFLAKAIQS